MKVYKTLSWRSFGSPLFSDSAAFNSKTFEVSSYINVISYGYIVYTHTGCFHAFKAISMSINKN